MPDDIGGAEAVILQAMLPSLEADGFQVFIQPSALMLPLFMDRYRPDAIALKADKKIAIEVVRHPGNKGPRLSWFQHVLSEHPEWELRLVYAPPLTSTQPMAVAPREMLDRSLDRLPSILDQAGSVAALLTAWSVFEAAARSIVPDHLAAPQPTARLIEILASDGHVTPDEAERLRRLGRLRNEAAHGRLDVTLTSEQLADLVAVTRTILDSPAAEMA